MQNNIKAPKKELSVREICTATGKILKEYTYNGYFDVSKRKNLHKVAYMVKNGKNVFLNGVHVNEIRKILRKAAETENFQELSNDENAFTEIEKVALRLSPVFIKYEKEIHRINLVKDIQQVCHLAKEYVFLKEKYPKTELANANPEEDTEIADKVTDLMAKFNNKN